MKEIMILIKMMKRMRMCPKKMRNPVPPKGPNWMILLLGVQAHLQRRTNSRT